MNHFSPSSDSFFLSKRAVFLKGPKSNAERLTAQATELQENLDALGIKVSEEQTRASLEDLQRGIEVEQSVQEQEKSEVSELVSSIENLETAEEREHFMGDVQQRLAVLLGLLVNDGDLDDESLKPENIKATLQRLGAEKETIKLADRSLYDHEKQLLELQALLDSTQTPELREAWNLALQNLRTNVQLTRAAAQSLSAPDTQQDAEGFSLSKEAGKVLESVKEVWKEATPLQKGIAVSAAAIGSLWLLSKLFRSDSGRGSSSTLKVLGIGALLAGGLYIGGKFLKLNEKLEQIDPQKLMAGAKAYVEGNYQEAKRILGEHYDSVVENLFGKKAEEEESPQETQETDENGEVPADRALRNYYEELRVLADPLVSQLEANDHLIWLAGISFPVLTTKLTLASLSTGKTLAAPLLLLLSFGARQAAKHPVLSSLLVVSYFAHRATQDEGYKLPATLSGLKNRIKTEREGLARYIRENGIPTAELSDEQIERIASVLSGEKTIAQAYNITPNELKDMAINAITEGIRVDDLEKLKDRNQDGLADFRSTLHGFNEPEKYNPFISYLIELRDKMKTTLTSEQLSGLISEAAKYGIMIWTENEDGYIWWRRDGHPDETYSCGVDPNLPVQKQIEAAIRFSPNPNDLAESFSNAIEAGVVEEVREGVSEIVSKVSNGEYSFIIGGTATLIWDGVKERYLKLPWNLATRVVKALQGEKFQTKEFLFDCAGGMVPIAVLGTALAVPRWAASKLFGTALGTSKLRILFETVTFPVTGPVKLGYGFGKRVMVPFGRGLYQGGMRRPWQAITEVLRTNVDDAASLLRRIRYDISWFTRLPEDLQHGFRRIIALEDAAVELSKLKTTFKQTSINAVINRARSILTDARIPESEISRLIPDNAGKSNLKSLLGNLSTELQDAKQALKASGELSAAEKVTDGARTGSWLDEAADAGRSSSWTDELADAVKGGSFMDEAADAGRASSWVDEALQSGRGAQLFGEVAEETTRAARVAEGVAETSGDLLRLETTLSETLEVIRNGRPLEPEHLARIRLAVREGASAEEIASAIRATGASQETAESAVQVLRQEKNIGKLMQALDNLGVLRFGRALRGLGNVALRCIGFVGRVAAPIAPIVGVGFNGYQAYAAWEMAQEFKENNDLKELYEKKAGMFATAGFADIAIEVLYFAGKVGVRGNLALSAGVMALQYMVEGAMDARAETLMGSNDYIRIGKQNGIEELLHRWYTTGEDTNAGEEYDSVFTLGNRGQEHYEFHRAFTREKIIDALLTLTSPGRTDEYIRYRKNYIASQAYKFNVYNFQQGQQLLAHSMGFASIMEDRSKQLRVSRPEGGTEMISLDDQRFDVHRISTEDINRIYGAGREQLSAGFQQFLRENIGGNEEKARQLFERVRGLDRSYLNHSISVIYAYLHNAGEGADQNSLEKWASLSALLVSYLQYEGVTFTFDQTAVADERTMAAMNQIFFNDSLKPLEVESLKGEFARPSAAVAALYEVAQFYGYKGRPREEDLKNFFNVAHEGMYGIYWSAEWKTNELGRVTADSRHGRSLDEAVKAIIRRFKEHPDRILESRHDYLTDELFGQARDDEVRRHDQIRMLASRMESIYQTYEAPDMEYQLSYLQIPLAQRAQLHEAMGDPPDGYDEYSMRRIVLLYEKSRREPFDPRMETRSFRLWAQTESPKRASVLEYFNRRKNNFNMAGIEDRRMLSQLNTDLNSFDQVFPDLTQMGASNEEIEQIRRLYTQTVENITRVTNRIDRQQTHPINNPTWVQWREIEEAMRQFEGLMSQYTSTLSRIGVMDYWKENGERDRYRERQRRRQSSAETASLREVVDRDPEVIRAKQNISFEIDSLILLLNRARNRNRQLEENYVNALNTIRQKVVSQTSRDACLSVFRAEMENFQRDFNRGFVGVDVVDVKKLWEGENGREGYQLATVRRLMDTIIHRQLTISSREGRGDLVGEIPRLDELQIPSEPLARAKFNLNLEVNYLKRELNRVRQRDPQFEMEYLNRLNEIERRINAQQSYESCVNTFKAELTSFFENFINPNANKVNQIWGERYMDVMVAELRSLVGAVANIDSIAGRQIVAEVPIVERANETPSTEYERQVQHVRDLNTQMNLLVRQINDAAASDMVRARSRGLSTAPQPAQRIDINQLRRQTFELQAEIDREEEKLAELRRRLGIPNPEE